MSKEQFGALIGLSGTIVSVVSSTPNLNISSRLRKDLDVVGNILEVAGTAIAFDDMASAQEQLGNVLSIIGNIEVAFASSVKTVREERLFDKQGTLLQILGGVINLPPIESVHLFQINKDVSQSDVLSFFGQMLDIIGNTIQLLAGEDSESAEMITAIGGWLQVVGVSFLTATTFKE